MVLRTNNNKTITKHKPKKYEIQPIPIAIKLLGFLLKKGQYVVPNNIGDQIAHLCTGMMQLDIGHSTVNLCCWKHLRVTFIHLFAYFR